MLLLELRRDFRKRAVSGWKANATASNSGITSASANADGQ
jgi:hypothetical protein